MVSDPVKVQARKSGDVWVVNPDYQGKDPSNMYINSKFKQDEFGNTTILDKRAGSPTENDYVSEDQFKEFRFTEPKEAMEYIKQDSLSGQDARFSRGIFKKALNFRNGMFPKNITSGEDN